MQCSFSFFPIQTASERLTLSRLELRRTKKGIQLKAVCVGENEAERNIELRWGSNGSKVKRGDRAENNDSLINQNPCTR